MYFRAVCLLVERECGKRPYKREKERKREQETENGYVYTLLYSRINIVVQLLGHCVHNINYKLAYKRRSYLTQCISCRFCLGFWRFEP